MSHVLTLMHAHLLGLQGGYGLLIAGTFRGLGLTQHFLNNSQLYSNALLCCYLLYMGTL